MILERLSTDADLSEASLAAARSRILGEPHTLYVGPDLIKEGVKLCRAAGGISLRVDTRLAPDVWYVVGPWAGVFSPGA